MNRRQSEWEVFGHILTTSELSMYICMAVTFACGVASILVGIIVSVLLAIAILVSGILLLLLTFVWFQVGATRQMQMSLESEKIEIIEQPEGIFHQSISVLERGRMRGGWRKVRFYESAVGISDPSSAKDEWLKSLKLALERGNVQSFSAVYALPLDKPSFETYAKGRLELFENTPNTTVHYLPPEDDAHPTSVAGLGAIIFADPSTDRYEVIFAFVGEITGGAMLRSGFVVRDQRIGRLVAEWFDTQILNDKSRTYVLRGVCPGKGQVNFKEELARIEQHYYASPAPVEALTKPEEAKAL